MKLDSTSPCVCPCILRQSSEKDRTWCWRLCVCVCASDYFTSCTPNVPATGLSHSYWPRCPPLSSCQTFSSTRGPRRQKRWWRRWRCTTGKVFDVLRHLYWFPKNIFTRADKHRVTLLPHHGFCFCPNREIYVGSVPHCSVVPTACRLQSLTFFWFGFARISFYFITNCVSFLDNK